jgi:hypothetical protein
MEHLPQDEHSPQKTRSSRKPVCQMYQIPPVPTTRNNRLLQWGQRRHRIRSISTSVPPTARSPETNATQGKTKKKAAAVRAAKTTISTSRTSEKPSYENRLRMVGFMVCPERPDAVPRLAPLHFSFVNSVLSNFQLSPPERTILSAERLSMVTFSVRGTTPSLGISSVFSSRTL